jgi:hypothetical protein
MIKRFKYFICARDLIEIAQGNMSWVQWHIKKPKQCSDSFCDQEILEVLIEVVNNKKSETAKSNKNKKRRVLRSRLPKRNKK